MIDNKKKPLGKRDERITKAVGIKRWDGKRVIASIKCYNCDMRRLIYTCITGTYMTEMGLLQEKLESMLNRFCFGNLLFDDNHPLS